MVGDKKLAARGMKAKHTGTAKKPATKQHLDAETQGLVTVDRRENRLERRRSVDRRVHQIPVAADRRLAERRTKVNRRRQIDPTTCERDYTPEEVEFMGAMDNYKRRSGRMFPTCSEVLEVVRSLGYVKQVQVEPAVLPTVNVSVTPIEASLVSGS